MIFIPYLDTKEEYKTGNKNTSDVRIAGQSNRYSEYRQTLPPTAQSTIQRKSDIVSQENTNTVIGYDYSSGVRKPVYAPSPPATGQTNAKAASTAASQENTNKVQNYDYSEGRKPVYEQPAATQTGPQGTDAAASQENTNKVLSYDYSEGRKPVYEQPAATQTSPQGTDAAASQGNTNKVQSYDYSTGVRQPINEQTLPAASQTKVSATATATLGSQTKVPATATATLGSPNKVLSYDYSTGVRQPINEQTLPAASQTSMYSEKDGVFGINPKRTLLKDGKDGYFLDSNYEQKEKDFSKENPAKRLTNEMNLFSKEFNYSAVHIDGETDHFTGQINLGNASGGVNVFAGPRKDENEDVNGYGVGAKINASASAMNMSGTYYPFGRENEYFDANYSAKLDLLKTEVAGNLAATISEDEVSLGAEGKLGAYLATGAYTATYTTPFFDVIGTINGSAGAGLKGAAMIEDGKLSLYGGAAALVGGGVGVDIDFSKFIDLLDEN